MMTDPERRRWTVGARLAGGLVVSAAAVAGVLGGVVVPWPTLTRDALAVSVEPAPSDVSLVCAGDLYASGADRADATALTLAATQTVTMGGGESSEAPEEAHLEVSEKAVARGPVTATARTDGITPVEVAASGAATADRDDLVGLAASACRPPLLESWLVGGSASTGAADLVLLSNPGAVPADITLTVFGTDGPVTPAGGSLVVPAGSQRIVPLAGLALGEATPVVRVSATGAPVAAALQASDTRVLEAEGVDQITAMRAPQLAQVMTGVVVTRGAASTGAGTVVRMLAPSDDGTATVTVTDADTTAAVRATTPVTLAAGRPLELELDALPAGSYTITVDASVPVVAATRQDSGSSDRADFAWYAPSPEIDAPTLFAVPAAPSPTLTVHNSGGLAATVRIVPVDGGDPIELLVPAHVAVSTRVDARTVYRLDPGATEPVRVALSFTGTAGIAGFPVWPSDAATPDLTVYP